MSRLSASLSPHRITATLVLSGLVLGALAGSVQAAPELLPDQSQAYEVAQVQRRTRLPRSVSARVIREISRQYDVPTRNLRISDASRENWPDSCLGLGGPAESCLTVMVPGWRIHITNNQQTWIYRTDDTARQLRLESYSGQSSVSLPNTVRNAVLQTAARELNQPQGRLRVANAQPQTWPDRCLGLPRPTELCAPALTEGWRIEVTNGQQTWIYRSDATGQVVRRESNPSSSTRLPNETANRVLQAAARASGRPASALRIVESEPRTWNGCLGLDPGPQGACTEIAISGWRVLVTDGQQGWIYHTDGNGSRVELNERASQTRAGLVPQFLSRSQSPPYVASDVVFRMQSSGGIAGQQQEIVLMTDGRLMQRQGTTAPRQIRRLTRQQVQQFETLLGQQRLGDFDHVRYPAPTGAADYFTVTLSSSRGVVQYADISQNDLPPALRSVIQAWDAIVRSR